jgi:hypothetical protein
MILSNELYFRFDSRAPTFDHFRAAGMENTSRRPFQWTGDVARHRDQRRIERIELRYGVQ